MDFLTLTRTNAPAIVDGIAEIARENGLTNVFNPSVANTAGAMYIAFRAESFPGEKPFRAFVVRLEADRPGELMDLTAEASTAGVDKAADPKLVMLGDELYVTFNTGNVNEGQNDIFLRRIAPTPGPLQRCLYPRRRAVEKNWAFYLPSGGALHAIYSLAPLSLLRLTAGEPGVTDTLTFEAERSTPISTGGEFPRLHIGSQPLLEASGRAILVANQQVKVPKLPRKLYFGRMVELDLSAGSLTRLSRRGLLHSWPSMLPPRLGRHNPMLWSATYFAGLAREGADLVLGYGINDTSLGVARVAESAVWR